MQKTFNAMSEIFELTTLMSKEDLWMDVRGMKKILRRDDDEKKEGEMGNQEIDNQHQGAPTAEDAQNWNFRLTPSKFDNYNYNLINLQ